MSFLAATSSTSIWRVWSLGSLARIWVSMFTTFTSKGMYCSASHWMLSSSSSWNMRGMEIFLMITEWPDTPMSTSIASFPFAIVSLPFPHFDIEEDLLAVRNLEPEGKDDLALGVQPAVLPALHAVDGEDRDARAARQLGLGQELLLSQLLHGV